jgi:uncharacterized PurR-regulated membrane protein YhhQ (DUF165 family)
MGGFILGTILGQFAGAWAYWQARRTDASSRRAEWLAAAAGGLVSTLVASAVYVALGVHIWLSGEGTSWGASVFLAVCMSLVQAVLFRGRPSLRQVQRR